MAHQRHVAFAWVHRRQKKFRRGPMRQRSKRAAVREDEMAPAGTVEFLPGALRLGEAVSRWR